MVTDKTIKYLTGCFGQNIFKYYMSKEKAAPEIPVDPCIACLEINPDTLTEEDISMLDGTVTNTTENTIKVFIHSHGSIECRLSFPTLSYKNPLHELPPGRYELIDETLEKRWADEFRPQKSLKLDVLTLKYNGLEGATPKRVYDQASETPHEREEVDYSKTRIIDTFDVQLPVVKVDDLHFNFFDIGGCFGLLRRGKYA